MDLGASAGGFTRVLLEHGARRVFAVDAGHGQLRGELRNHSRVVNLERTNLADLSAIPRCTLIGTVTMDLSYLSVADAAPQIETLPLAPDADLIALVKPMFDSVSTRLPRTIRRSARPSIWPSPAWSDSPGTSSGP